MLLSILVVDQLMIYLLANLGGEGRRILPAVSSLMEKSCPRTGDSLPQKWSLQFFNYLIGCSHWKHSSIWDIWIFIYGVFLHEFGGRVCCQWWWTEPYFFFLAINYKVVVVCLLDCKLDWTGVKIVAIPAMNLGFPIVCVYMLSCHFSFVCFCQLLKVICISADFLKTR